MTAKQFFKSNVFKCLVALLCVLLVSGIFLTVMNGLLEVTAEEKRNRAISKIYGTQVDVEELKVDNYNASAEIEEAYKVTTDGNYLIKSKGLGAYKGGTVTCWIVVTVKDGAVSGIGKVVIDSNTNQTLMSQFGSSVLDQFSQKYNPDEEFTNEVITGATAVLTENAICNAVNGAVDYVKAQLGGSAEANPFEGFAYTENINTAKDTKYELDGGNVLFTVRTTAKSPAGYFTIKITVKPDGTIKTYEVIRYGSVDGEDKTKDEYNALVDQAVASFAGKDINYFKSILGDDMAFPAGGLGNDVPSGATYSNYLCLYAGAFATANYQTALDKLNAQTKNNGEVTA